MKRTCEKHGYSRTKVYAVWKSMKNRCFNPKDDRYADYGGRGITVCQRWLSFSNFISDMGKRPDGMTLDRINNDGDYEPGNCRWASYQEQNRNTRWNRMVTFNGTTMCVQDWASRLGMTHGGLTARLRRGYPLEKALTPPAPALQPASVHKDSILAMRHSGAPYQQIADSLGYSITTIWKWCNRWERV